MVLLKGAASETSKTVKRANTGRKQLRMTDCIDILTSPHHRVRLSSTPAQCKNEVTSSTVVKEESWQSSSDGGNNSTIIAIVRDSE